MNSVKPLREIPSLEEREDRDTDAELLEVLIPPPQQPPASAKVLYLPVLGGGSEGSGHEGGGSGHTAEVSTGMRARSRRGFAYRGPRPMVSNPPRATLGIQTILQPALNNPPLLKQYVPLPD